MIVIAKRGWILKIRSKTESRPFFQNITKPTNAEYWYK